MKRLIPIELCHLCLNNRWCNQFRSYLALNMNSDGYLERKQAIRLLMSELKISRNTAKTHIDFCINRNWLGEHHGTLYIRSLDYIRAKEKATQRASVWLYKSYLINFKAFCFAALITQINRGLRRLKVAQNRKRTYQSLYSFYPIAGNLIKRSYNISNSTSTRLRRIAQSSGFIKVWPNLKAYKPDSKIHFKNELGYLKQNSPEYISKRLKTKNGIVVIQETIQMQTKLNFKRRRKVG